MWLAIGRQLVWCSTHCVLKVYIEKLLFGTKNILYLPFSVILDTAHDAIQNGSELEVRHGNVNM